LYNIFTENFVAFSSQSRLSHSQSRQILIVSSASIIVTSRAGPILTSLWTSSKIKVISREFMFYCNTANNRFSQLQHHRPLFLRNL